MPSFHTQTVLYVGCNLHTQARHVCCVVVGRGRAAETVADGKGAYVLVSLRQLDLFPQIEQVESIAILGPYRKPLCGNNFTALQGTALTAVLV